MTAENAADDKIIVCDVERGEMGISARYRGCFDWWVRGERLEVRESKADWANRADKPDKANRADMPDGVADFFMKNFF